VGEATLVRDLLERAIVPEPPIGPLAQNAVRAGLRLRRRRRIQGIAGAAIVVCAAAIAVTGMTANRTAGPADIPATVYVLGGSQAVGTVTPISTTTRRPGRPIVVRTGSENLGVPQQLALTPDGKTIWVADGNDNVTPISAATNRAGKPVRVVHGEYEGTDQVLATPDGKTVYVLDSYGEVTPISTATHKPGKPIKLGDNLVGDNADEMAITPDGKTLYVGGFGAPGLSSSYVIPIATATNRAGKPITVPTNGDAIVITPDGRTVYVIGQPSVAPRQRIEVTPIATASNRPGTPVIVGNGSQFPNPQVAMTPNGRTIYILDTNARGGVIPFSTVTNTPGKLISFGTAQVLEIAIAPDGSTAYVLSQPPGWSQHLMAGGGGALTCTGARGDVTPIATATNTVGTPIKVGCEPLSAAFTPDGRTLYVGGRSGTVTPITIATGGAGKPIKVKAPQEILIVPVPG
jgi:DNA-binding beta-propeller fold protein YncE